MFSSFQSCKKKTYPTLDRSITNPKACVFFTGVDARVAPEANCLHARCTVHGANIAAPPLQNITYGPLGRVTYGQRSRRDHPSLPEVSPIELWNVRSAALPSSLASVLPSKDSVRSSDWSLGPTRPTDEVLSAAVAAAVAPAIRNSQAPRQISR